VTSFLCHWAYAQPQPRCAINHLIGQTTSPTSSILPINVKWPLIQLRASILVVVAAKALRGLIFCWPWFRFRFDSDSCNRLVVSFVKRHVKKRVPLTFSLMNDQRLLAYTRHSSIWPFSQISTDLDWLLTRDWRLTNFLSYRISGGVRRWLSKTPRV